MAPPRRRAFLFAAIAVIAVVAIVVGIARRGGGKPATKPAAPGSDPWAQGGAAGPQFKRPAGDVGGALGLRTRPSGPPVTVTGVVRLSGAGTPVAGAEVAFMNEFGENTASADDSGRYSIEVASGVRWKVHARTETAVGYPEVFTPSADNLTRDLEVQPTATITGSVRGARGEPSPGAVVSIEVAAADRGLLEGALPMSTTADDSGRFKLATVPGTFKVKAAVGLAQGAAVVTALAPGDTLAVDIQLRDPVSLAGRVVDPEGRGVAGAKVLVAATIAEGGPTEKLQVDSADDGSFAITSPAGWIRIEARKLGDLSAASAQWYDSGLRKDGILLTLAPPVALRGKVLTSDGTPIVGARVRLSANAVYDTTSMSDGSFEVAAPGEQQYLVKIKHSDGQLERSVATWGAEQTFVMRRFGALRVVVAGATVETTVTIDSFLPTGETAARAPAESRFRGTGGVVSIGNLEPGSYDLTVATAGAGATRVPRVIVDEGGSRDVPVKLAAPVAVRGTVKSDRQPIAGAQVTIGARTTFTDAKGRWIVADVAAGPIAIAVAKSGFGSAWSGGVAAADGAPIDIELRATGAQVEGIGITVSPAPGGAVVASVLPGSPAEGKLVAGDVIAAVDGTDVSAAALDDIVGRLRGSAGSSVSITVRRGTDDETVDVTRKRLVVPTGTPAVAIARGPARAEARC